MRLGLLDAARASFNKAKSLKNGMPGGTLTDNMKFLKEHFEYAASINHDTKTMYPEYADGGGRKVVTDGYYGDNDDAYGGDSAYESSGSDSVYDSDYYGNDDVGSYDVPGGHERVTAEAIDLAESGDVLASLELFEKAAKMEPSSGKLHENLGVRSPSCLRFYGCL